jgi:hypothetical protein
VKRALFAVLCAGCLDHRSPELTVSLSTAGAPVSAVRVGDAELTLSRAELGFGPLYFCAAEAADAASCPEASLELRDTLAIDALAPRADGVAELRGTPSTLRSAMLDLGISWLLTRTEPAAWPSAPAGHSLVLAGELRRGTDALRFTATLDVVPGSLGEQAVALQLDSHALHPGDLLVATLDPARWAATLDADALFAADTDADGVLALASDHPALAALHAALAAGSAVQLTFERTEGP